LIRDKREPIKTLNPTGNALGKESASGGKSRGVVRACHGDLEGGWRPETRRSKPAT